MRKLSRINEFHISEKRATSSQDSLRLSGVFCKKVRVRKRYFLLLEVMICLFLVVMCILPLIAPHVFILQQQKKFIYQIELDHVVNLIFAGVVEKLYNNEIAWSDIADGKAKTIDDSFLEKFKVDARFPYQGSYRFSEAKHKPLEEGAKRILYLINLDMTFTPKGQEKKDKEGKIIGSFEYHYELFVVRDLE